MEVAAEGTVHFEPVLSEAAKTDGLGFNAS